MGKVGDASAYRVWGSFALVRYTTAGKLNPRTILCVFLGFPTDAPDWQFYHPATHWVLSSGDVTFDESVYYYCLFPHCSSPDPLPPLFLVPGYPPVDPLPSRVLLPQRREPSSRPASPVARTHRAPRVRPPPIPDTHTMALHPSSVPQHVVLPSPPASSQPDVPDPVADLARAASPTVVVWRHLHFELECFATAVPHLAAMMLAPEGDPNALDIMTPRSYAKAITGEYSSQWQTAMDTEMASWKVKRPPGSLPVFKARYVARGFSQRQGVEFFQTFSPTPKMTTLREIWLRRPPGFSGSFPEGTQWSLRWPVYILRKAPRKWHETLGTTLTTLGFAPSSADPLLFLCTDPSLPPFYILVYVDDLVFATGDTEALALVKAELQKRHTCTDLGELRSYLGLQITQDRAVRTITLIQSHMMQQVLQRFGFQFSLPQSTPLPTSHSLSAPPSDESVEPSGPCEAEIYAGAMAAQELRWLTYLLTDLGERPRSPPILYVDNKAMIALCREQRLEHKTKHIAVRKFLA
ncbi:unnamed protein product [Closterium sp. NIES-53]